MHLLESLVSEIECVSQQSTNQHVNLENGVRVKGNCIFEFGGLERGRRVRWRESDGDTSEGRPRLLVAPCLARSDDAKGRLRPIDRPL